MFVQNNSGPQVILVLVIITLMVILGVLIGNSELLNPERTAQEVVAQATRNALDVNATQIAMQPTIDAMQATAMPVQMTATSQAAWARVEEMSSYATQTAIVQQMQQQQQEDAFQSTRQAQESTQTKTRNNLEVGLIIACIAFIVTVGSAFVYRLISDGRAQKIEAETRNVLEQQRLERIRQRAVQKRLPAKYPDSISIGTLTRMDRQDDRDHTNLPLAN